MGSQYARSYEIQTYAYATRVLYWSADLTNNPRSATVRHTAISQLISVVQGLSAARAGISLVLSVTCLQDAGLKISSVL